jgi:hypothetical protein
VARAVKNSIWSPLLPKRHGMSAVPEAEGHHPQRGSRLARWVGEHEGTPPPAKWLFGEPNDQAGELAELRERLAESERRAADAEAALPHLLALGQRTVNGLLNDARTRGRQIIEEARAQAAVEMERERQALALEAAELDALRMAVACEAMGLEQVRAELEAGLAALQLHASADVPSDGARELPAASAVARAPDQGAPPLPPPPSPADLVSVGMTRGRPDHRDDSVTSRFAHAWAAGEDEMMTEAFDRFFAVEIGIDPLRDAVLDDEVGEADPRASEHSD